jgi:hypothetical protein
MNKLYGLQPVGYFPLYGMRGKSSYDKLYSLMTYSNNVETQSNVAKQLEKAFADESIVNNMIKEKYKSIPQSQALVPMKGEGYSKRFRFGMSRR